MVKGRYKTLLNKSVRQNSEGDMGALKFTTPSSIELMGSTQLKKVWRVTSTDRYSYIDIGEKIKKTHYGIKFNQQNTKFRWITMILIQPAINGQSTYGN
jgi:hypothetical protein